MPKYGRGQHRAGDTAAPPCPPRVSSPPRARPAASIPAAPVPPVSIPPASHPRAAPLPPHPRPSRSHPSHPCRRPVPPRPPSPRRAHPSPTALGWRGAQGGIAGCETPVGGGFGPWGGGAPSAAPAVPPPHVTPTHAAPTRRAAPLQGWHWGGPALLPGMWGGPAGGGAAPRVPAPPPKGPPLWGCTAPSGTAQLHCGHGGRRGARGALGTPTTSRAPPHGPAHPTL